MRHTGIVFQVIFNEISAAEISQLPTLEQLEVLNEFQVKPEDLDGIEDNPVGAKFGQIERDGKKLYRYRASDVRIYFEVSRDHRSVIVHRVLSKNSFQDFLFRANLPVGDDDALAQSKSFWALIEEGERARKV
jgi:mRNA-degrading endonuclease RelE of RelBE toxin-antitoxin system